MESVNARGDYAIEADRLAFIDGDRDPWRPVVSNAVYSSYHPLNTTRLHKATLHPDDILPSTSRCTSSLVSRLFIKFGYYTDSSQMEFTITTRYVARSGDVKGLADEPSEWPVGSLQRAYQDQRRSRAGDQLRLRMDSAIQGGAGEEVKQKRSCRGDSSKISSALAVSAPKSPRIVRVANSRVVVLGWDGLGWAMADRLVNLQVV